MEFDPREEKLFSAYWDPVTPPPPPPWKRVGGVVIHDGLTGKAVSPPVAAHSPSPGGNCGRWGWGGGGAGPEDSEERG